MNTDPSHATYDEEAIPDSLRLPIRWLCRLRFIALFVLAFLGWLSFPTVFLIEQWAAPYYLTLVFLGIFNLRCVARETRLRNDQVPNELFIQVTTDLVVAGLLLVFTGGIRNPLFSLLFIHAAVGAFLLAGVRLFSFALVFFGVVLASFFSRNLQVISGNFYANEILPLASTGLGIAVVFTIVGWLARTLQRARNLEERRVARGARLENLLATGALAADFSHRFATPLNNLQLRLKRAIGKVGGDEVITSDLVAASKSAEHCESLLRELASTTLDSSMLQFNEVDLNEVVVRTVRQWEASSPGCRASLQVSEGSALLCRVPEILLAKAIANLLENSAHHQQNAGEIQVRIWRLGAFAEIEVRDEGPGWPETILNEGIRPFGSSRPGGTGLGLHNTLSLCEALGGRFEISNAPQGGARVLMSLPLVGAGKPSVEEKC